jgi:hypothetical protein
VSCSRLQFPAQPPAHAAGVYNHLSREPLLGAPLMELSGEFRGAFIQCIGHEKAYWLLIGNLSMSNRPAQLPPGCETAII